MYFQQKEVCLPPCDFATFFLRRSLAGASSALDRHRRDRRTEETDQKCMRQLHASHCTVVSLICAWVYLFGSQTTRTRRAEVCHEACTRGRAGQTRKAALDGVQRKVPLSFTLTRFTVRLVVHFSSTASSSVLLVSSTQGRLTSPAVEGDSSKTGKTRPS